MDVMALTALTLLALGGLFILAEVLFGSDGSLSVMAVVCWIAAAWFGWKGLAQPLGWEWWLYALLVLFGIPILAGIALAVLPHSPAGRKMFAAPDPEEVRPFSDDEERWRESFVGEIGQSLTWMNPGGLVLIEGQRHHAESEGMPIAPGQTVQIIDLRANRFVVRVFDQSLLEAPADPAPEDLAY